ncbi:Presequence protease, mitochondrial [Bonamia ostreae]|uniref:Presequence protease, mitochondrial n=1 Tax=Bonamia ostreae TaxID=126728 RepID=A0ABV2ASN6_9EUKA
MNWNYLHNEIRVKGNAYGSGAYQKYDIFGMYSLADPNCAKTLKTFQNCIEWASNDENKTENNKVEQMTENDVKKAILATFSTIDSPVSPSKRGKAFFVNGLSDETRQKIRDRLLKVDKKSILRVARKYLLGNSKFVGQNSKNGEISNASISVAGAVDVTEKKRLEDVLEWTEIQNNF